MRNITSKDGDLLSHFDKIDEFQDGIGNTSLHHHLINNHEVAASKGKITGQIPFQHFFGFCRTFRKITKQLGFHLTFRTADPQDITYKSLGDNIKVNFDKLFLFVSIFIPDAETQIMFNDSMKNSLTLSFDSLSTDKKTVDTQLENQVDIDSAQNIKSPKYLKVPHQTRARIGVPNKANNIAVFGNLNVRKYHSDNDGSRYPRDGVSIDYAAIGYIGQYRYPKLFHKEHVGEELLKPFISYADQRTKHPIQVSDLRFEVDHNNAKKFQ